MGQEASSPVDESVPPKTLRDRTVEGLAEYIKSGKARRIVVMVLRPEGLLHRLFTQNIDCLEREAGVPDDKIVEAHGSFATQRCIECRTPYSGEEMKEHVVKMEVPRCKQSHCQGLVKPDIVFFGEQLPVKFFQEREAPSQADLCLVMGTSLTVQPFASLPSFVEDRVPRVLINLERVGGIGNRSDDVLVLGDCDTGVKKIAEACGWLEELEAEWASTVREDTEAAKADADGTAAEAAAPKDRDAALEAAVEKLTREIDETLKVSSDHIERIKAEHAGENLPIDGDEAKAYTGEKLKDHLEKIKEKGDTSQERHSEEEGSKDAMTERIKQEVLNPSEDQGLDHVYPHIKKSSL
ncbi:MAG: hypothetical protein Q9165_004816 [Trypethelium subeluteriae]